MESSKAERADLLLYRQLRLEVNRVEAVVRMELQRQNQQPVHTSVARNQIQRSFSRQRTTADAGKGASQVTQSTDLRRETPGSGDRRQKLMTASALSRLRWLRAREHLLTDKSYSLQAYRERVEATADILTANSKQLSSSAFKTCTRDLTIGSLVEAGMTMEAKTLAADVGFELRKLNDQINDAQVSINKLRDEISTIESELTETDLRQLDEQPGLDARVRLMVEGLRQLFAEQHAENEANHASTLAELRLRTDLERNTMNELISTLRYKLRAKMHEVHRRDVVLRKLKRELTVISRYHAKNMNAQVRG